MKYADDEYYEATLVSIDRKSRTAKVAWVEFEQVDEVNLTNILLDDDDAQNYVEEEEVGTQTKAVVQEQVMVVDKTKHSVVIGKGGNTIKVDHEWFC